MFREFEPLVRNPHALTILSNYWPRRFDFTGFPIQRRFIATEPDVRVRVDSQIPSGLPRAHLVILHGLEGSGQSGYIVSLAYAALLRNFAVHRFHMRTCGETEQLCQTLYHAGLTGDLLSFVRQEAFTRPVFLVGFSLGGNVALKSAAEAGTELISGVATVAAPIDLKASARRLHALENRLYENRFVSRMKMRIRRTGRYSEADLARCKTLYDIDNWITAPSFGMESADRYYSTQSALRIAPFVRIPALLIAAQDDPIVPYESYLDPAVVSNPFIRVVAPKHGGHLGFLARQGRRGQTAEGARFWVDHVVLTWIESLLSEGASGSPVNFNEENPGIDQSRGECGDCAHKEPDQSSSGR